MATEFSEVYRRRQQGKIRIASSGLAWQDSQQKDVIVTVSSTSVRYGTISRGARGFQLRLDLKRGNDREVFDGFKAQDVERLIGLFRDHFGTLLQQRDMSLRGWNWGHAEIQGQDLTFMVVGKPAFDVPVSHVHNTTINKTEVALEFLHPDAAMAGGKPQGSKDVDELVEMRLYIPGSAAAARKREKKEMGQANGENGVKAESESDEPSDVDDAEQTAAQAFHDEVKEKAEVGHVSGEALVTFSEIHCATPRGRYDIDLFPSFFRLRSKSYDYKILYASVMKMFLLPRTDDVNVILVANLDPPIRQGQTRYPYLIMQFARDEDMEAEMNLTEDDIAEYKSKDINFERRYDAPAFEVVSNVFRQLTGKKPVVPNGSFQSNDGQTAIKCNLKANEGHLYFLEKYMIFIAKQPLLLPFNEVHQVRFERVSGVLGSSRSFDLRVVMRSGEESTFSSVAKDEHSPISEYLKERNVSVKNEMQEEMISISAAIQAAEASDSDMSEDEPRRRAKDADEDSDEEVDEDFKAGEESDVAEEYDENYNSSGDSDAAGSGSGSGSGSNDEEEEEGSNMEVDEATAAPTNKRAGSADGGTVPKKAKTR